MAPPLAELTAQAQTLTAAGDLVAARAVLADALDPVDADPQRASPDLADAASLLARILIALGDPHAARLWAGFAHAAGDRLYGPHDERTVAAAALHAAVLHRIGNHGRAAQLYHDLVGELTTLDGRDSPRVLAAEADLATAEHAAGHCTAARARLADAWARHRQVYGDAVPAGIKMLARLGAMERECGRTAESQENLALVQELCARYLPADHPLAVQAAGLAQAPESGRHICGRMARSAGPAADPGVRPVHPPDPPGVRSVPAEPYREDPWGAQPYRPGAPSGGPGVSSGGPGVSSGGLGVSSGGLGVSSGGPGVSSGGPGVSPGGPGVSPGRSGVPSGRPAEGPQRTGPPGPAPPIGPWPLSRPAQPEPDDRPTDPHGLYQQPLYLSDVHQSPGELAGRPAPADPPPPVPGQRAPEVGPDGRQIRIGAVPVEAPTRADPLDRRLPVPVDRPEPRGSWQPLVLVAVLVAGIAVGAAVVIATLPGADGGSSPASRASAGASRAAVPPATAPPSAARTSASPAASGLNAGPPPGDVQLRDNRDSVSLDWTYPKGAEGPVLISGARTGEQQRAFQQLPAGTTNYVVYGLNERLDYCFTVAVVYTVDHVAASKPFCTKRG